DVHRQVDAAIAEPGAQAVGLADGDLGQRRDAAEVVVVPRDFFDALERDTAAAQHVRQERPDVCRSLRPAESHDQDGIKRYSHDGAPRSKSIGCGGRCHTRGSCYNRWPLTSSEEAVMIVVRNCFIAKPGNASKLAAQIK